MKQHRFRLTGPRATGARLSAVVMRDLLDALINSARHAVRLRVDGRDMTGALPAWLDRISDLTVLPLEAGSTRVVVEAPTLAEAAPDRFAQVDYVSALSPDETSVDVLEESLADALSGNDSADRFDAGLLRTFGQFSRLWRYQIEAIEFEGAARLRLDPSGTARLDALQKKMPAEQRTIVVGKLDQLHHSKRMFTIRTDDGQDLRGVLANDDTAVDSLAPLFGQRAQVAGIAKFRASGTLWLIEADAVAPAAPGASPLSKAPKPLFPALDARSLHKSQGPKSGVAAVFGRWPGDETDSEIEDLLAENS